MRNTFIILLVVLSACQVWAQSKKELADKAFENKEYWAAIEQYKKHLEKDRNPGARGEVYYSVAESYRNLLQYSDALEWYKKAEGAQYQEPNLYFQKGRVLLNLGEYTAAKDALNKFLSLQPNDKDGVRLLNNVDFALGLQKDPPPLYTVINEGMLNTEYIDYGATWFEGDVVFTSSRMEDVDNKLYTKDGQGFSNLFKAHYDTEGKTWDKPIMINTLSSKFNDGVFTYSADTKMAYFSQCGQEKGEFCVVMQSKYDATAGNWSEPEPIDYEGERVEMVHPTVSKDGNSMWVVSRKKEGKGGSDIWLLERRGLSWSAPIAIDAINTEYDEAFPVWYNDTTLYLASNGFTGMGGLDLFVSIKREGKWNKPGNMKLPFNSSADDFLIVFDKTQEKGYFSSNRQGGKGSDDIYSFFMTPVFLNVMGHVTDTETGGGLAGVTVVLRGDDGSVDSTVTDANGNYSFKLDKNVDYKINLNKPEYFGDSRKLSTVGELYSKDFNKENGYDYDFALMKIPKEEITIDDIYYDYNKADLRPESMTSLDKLVKLLDDSPDVQVVINSHSDERGDNKYNMELSEARAQSVVDYLISKGINPARLDSKGWGETALLVKNAKTEEEHQQNRRTTFKVINQ